MKSEFQHNQDVKKMTMSFGLSKVSNNRKTTKGRNVQFVKLSNGKTKRIIHLAFKP